MNIVKNRERAEYSFANINLLGKCNADCFFCLGKDIAEELGKHNQLNIHFLDWKNFTPFLHKCRELGIKKLYLTGQNTDALLYKHIWELKKFLNVWGFCVGVRTNGYLAMQDMNMLLLNNMECSVGYSIHTLKPETNYKIMGRKDLPRWRDILPQTRCSRVAIVVNEYNAEEFFDLVRYIAQFDNVKYIQARRISTDTRFEQMKPHIEVYEKLAEYVAHAYKDFRMDDFYGAERYKIYGKEVCFWRTVETKANSINYFTDGTISEEYFVVEGYMKHKEAIK